MKKLTTMWDGKLKQSYDLYQTSAKELIALIRSVYEQKGMNSLFVQRFNASLEIGPYRHRYADKLSTLHAMQAGVKMPYYHESYNSDKLAQEIGAFEEAYQRGDIKHPEEDAVGSLGIEQMPFALSVPQKDVARNLGELELIDGFRRVFYMENVPDQDVLVKVYDTLEDDAWMSAMVVFNAWKFADNTHSLRFMDRGFKLGLFKRYEMDATKLYGYKDDSLENSLKEYIQKEPYSTFWQNGLFVQDVQFMQQVKLHLPVFTAKTKKKEETVDIGENPFNYPFFLSYINRLVYREMGSVRREETKRLEAGETVERQLFVWENYTAFLEQEDLQAYFIKLNGMQTWGHIENNVDKNLSARIKQIICP